MLYNYHYKLIDTIITQLVYQLTFGDSFPWKNFIYAIIIRICQMKNTYCTSHTEILYNHYVIGTQANYHWKLNIIRHLNLQELSYSLHLFLYASYCILFIAPLYKFNLTWNLAYLFVQSSLKITSHCHYWHFYL